MTAGLGPDAYCREVERHLCRKNDGHLIRLVGPSFELVRGWADAGVPLSIVRRGVDQYVERYYAKGPRRRPVRIEFCEGDVLALFDRWRRATGISLTEGAGSAPGDAAPGAARSSLPAHLDRLLARVDECLARPEHPPDVRKVLLRIHEEVEVATHGKTLRGETRAALLVRLQQLDDELIAAARGAVSDVRRTELARVAELELAPFRERMDGTSFARALQASIDRLTRDDFGLPIAVFG